MGGGRGGGLVWTDLTEYKTPAIFIRTVSAMISLLFCVLFFFFYPALC